MEILVFAVEGERYGVWTEDVREVVRAVAVSRLPGAPPIVHGVIGVRGRLVPVLDLRARFGLPRKEVDPAELFVIADAAGRMVAVRADRVEGISWLEEGMMEAPDVGDASSGLVSGAARLGDGMVLVHDLAAFLSAAEAASLDASLAAAAEDAA